MGKERQALPSVLSFKEKLKLKSMVEGELKEYESKIGQKYHDSFEASLLMESSLTKEKNEILRKIKFMRMKDTNLPDFKRKRTEELLQQRKIDQKIQDAYLNMQFSDTQAIS